MSLSLSIHSSSTGREPVCERHTWTAVVGTGLVVEFFQPLQGLLSVGLSNCISFVDNQLICFDFCI